jgi:hypothetical protein
MVQRRQERSASRCSRATLARFTPEARKANKALVDLLGAIGRRTNATGLNMS